jgi:hypothetical protein
VEVPFVPDKSRAVYCKECLKKSRRGEIKIKMQSVEAAKEEKEEKQPVPLAEITKQTVNFKQRQAPSKIEREKIKGEEGLGSKVERPRIEPPPIRTAASEVEKKPEIVAKMEEKASSVSASASSFAKASEDKKASADKSEVKEEVLEQAEPPKPQSASVDLLQHFKQKENKEIKEGEEIEL